MPRDEEELHLYISATPQVVSAVLVAEREEVRDDAKVVLPGEHTGSTMPHPSTDVSDLGTIVPGPCAIIPGPSAATPDPGVVIPSPGAITLDLGATPGASPTKPRRIQCPMYFISKVL